MLDAVSGTMWFVDTTGVLLARASWASDADRAQPTSDSGQAWRALSEDRTLSTATSLCVPVRIGSTPEGVLEFARRGRVPARTNAVESAEILAGGIGMFLERQRKDAELARARDEALEASELKSRFLANMSHEIRTPMNGVIGMTELLLESDLDDEQRRWASTLRTSSSLLLSVIDEVLDFSKVEAGRLEIERTEFDLHDMLCATTDLVDQQARAKGLTLEASIERHLPRRAWGDPARLQQVLGNLLSNAVKFTETGGVTMRAHVARDRRGAMRVEVSDTGIGIEPDKIGALFDAFSQADASTTRRFGGTGLGLSIARELVELMGGEIGATSMPGVGTTFWFHVPIGRARDAVDGAAQDPADRSPSGMPRPAPAAHAPELQDRLPVLVVDDNAVNQAVARQLLLRRGYLVDVATDGAAAVRALVERAYAAVLMDCQMPVLDGYEATRRIRSAEVDGAHVPIIAMTSSTTSDDRQACLAVGMDDFLPKPVTASALEAVVRRWTDPGANGDAAHAKVAADPAPAQEGDADVDVAVLTGLTADLGGDPAIVAELVSSFCATTTERVAVARSAVEGDDPEMLAQAAHSLKGSSATLGARRLAALAAALETNARAGRMADAPRAVEELAAAAEAAITAMRVATASPARER